MHAIETDQDIKSTYINFPFTVTTILYYYGIGMHTLLIFKYNVIRPPFI